MDFKQWGSWDNGNNIFPITFTQFYKITACGLYSFNNNDNAITNVSNLSYFSAQKKHNSITNYIVIGV